MKYFFITLILTTIFSGCSAKKINENVDSITNDITNTFEAGIDKSSK